MTRLNLLQAAAVDHAVFRLGPVSPFSILRTVHAIVGRETLPVEPVEAYLLAHPWRFAMTEDGWSWIAASVPPNPVAQPSYAPGSRTRAQILAEIARLGSRFRTADLRQVGIHKATIRGLILDGILSTDGWGKYLVNRARLADVQAQLARITKRKTTRTP